MPASGGAAKRVTFQGKYNQTPRWNPRADKPLIAFTGRDERGVFDIFILDVKTGKIDRVTQGKGSNLDPTWSPDGRLLAYTSSRGGLFVTNPETRHEVQIWRGAAEGGHREVVVITGASAGVGRATARKFAAHRGPGGAHRARARRPSRGPHEVEGARRRGPVPPRRCRQRGGGDPGGPPGRRDLGGDRHLDQQRDGVGVLSGQGHDRGRLRPRHPSDVSRDRTGPWRRWPRCVRVTTASSCR